MDKDTILNALAALVEEKTKAMAEAEQAAKAPVEEAANSKPGILGELAQLLGGKAKPEPKPDPEPAPEPTFTLSQLKEALASAKPAETKEVKPEAVDPLAALSAQLAGATLSKGSYTDEQVGRMSIDQINSEWDKISQDIER